MLRQFAAPRRASARSVARRELRFHHFIVARLCQKFLQAVGAAEQRGEVRRVDEHDVAGALGRSGGIQISALNSVLPAAVNGCGRLRVDALAAEHAQLSRFPAR